MADLGGSAPPATPWQVRPCMSSNRSLNIPLKNTLIFQNEHMAYYNPSSLVELFGSRVEISKPPIHSRVAGSELGNANMLGSPSILNFDVTYEKLGNLAQVSLNTTNQEVYSTAAGVVL